MKIELQKHFPALAGLLPGKKDATTPGGKERGAKRSSASIVSLGDDWEQKRLVRIGAPFLVFIVASALSLQWAADRDDERTLMDNEEDLRRDIADAQAAVEALAEEPPPEEIEGVWAMLQMLTDLAPGVRLESDDDIEPVAGIGNVPHWTGALIGDAQEVFAFGQQAQSRLPVWLGQVYLDGEGQAVLTVTVAGAAERSVW